MTLQGNAPFGQESLFQMVSRQTARNEFIQAIQSPSIQLLLMKEQPDTLDGALMLARRQQSVKLAQKNLSSTKSSHHRPHIVDKSTSEVLVAIVKADTTTDPQHEVPSATASQF